MLLLKLNRRSRAVAAMTQKITEKTADFKTRTAADLIADPPRYPSLCPCNRLLVACACRFSGAFPQGFFTPIPPPPEGASAFSAYDILSPRRKAFSGGGQVLGAAGPRARAISRY